MTGAAGGEGHVYPSKAHDVTPGFLWELILLRLEPLCYILIPLSSVFIVILFFSVHYIMHVLFHV